jgi:phosphoglycerol transferase MdoB-like AlkP superfamily enzyme
LGTQTDVASTLLAQLGLSTKNYTWGHNLLQSTSSSFAFYCFNSGFGMVSPSGTVTYDNVARQQMWRDEAVPKQQLTQGQAYEQASYADFMRK